MHMSIGKSTVRGLFYDWYLATSRGMPKEIKMALGVIEAYKADITHSALETRFNKAGEVSQNRCGCEWAKREIANLEKFVAMDIKRTRALAECNPAAIMAIAGVTNGMAYVADTDVLWVTALTYIVSYDTIDDLARMPCGCLKYANDVKYLHRPMMEAELHHAVEVVKGYTLTHPKLLKAMSSFKAKRAPLIKAALETKLGVAVCA